MIQEVDLTLDLGQCDSQDRGTRCWWLQLCGQGVDRQQGKLKGIAHPLSGGAEAGCHLEGLKDKRLV